MVLPGRPRYMFPGDCLVEAGAYQQRCCGQAVVVTASATPFTGSPELCCPCFSWKVISGVSLIHPLALNEMELICLKPLHLRSGGKRIRS